MRPSCQATGKAVSENVTIMDKKQKSEQKDAKKRNKNKLKYGILFQID